MTLLTELTNVVLLTPLTHGEHTLPAGSLGTIVSVFPLTGSYTVEFHDPVPCVIPAIPALALVAADTTIDEEAATLMAAYDRTGMTLRSDIDWSGCPAVQRRPGRLGGAWTVIGTRIPVVGVIENYNSGYTVEELATRIYHGLSVEVAREIIAYSADRS